MVRTAIDFQRIGSSLTPTVNYVQFVGIQMWSVSAVKQGADLGGPFDSAKRTILKLDMCADGTTLAKDRAQPRCDCKHSAKASSQISAG